MGLLLGSFYEVLCSYKPSKCIDELYWQHQLRCMQTLYLDTRSTTIILLACYAFRASGEMITIVHGCNLEDRSPFIKTWHNKSSLCECTHKPGLRSTLDESYIQKIYSDFAILLLLQSLNFSVECYLSYFFLILFSLADSLWQIALKRGSGKP